MHGKLATLTPRPSAARRFAASIGDGAVVGAGAVVVSPIPARSLALGVPAKVRRTLG